MKNEDIMKEIVNFSEKNFVTFSDKIIEEIKKELEKVKLQMMGSNGIKKEEKERAKEAKAAKRKNNKF